MVLDENLKALLQRGEAKERIQLPVEIGLILNDGSFLQMLGMEDLRRRFSESPLVVRL